MRATALLAVALVAGIGCGEEEKFAGSPDPAKERSDPPAKPPPGWRTFANRRAGFTLSVPPGWPARTRRTATLIRSPEGLVAVTVAADRSESGRTTRPRPYARRAFRALPGFRQLRITRTRPIHQNPYPATRIDGQGTLVSRGQRQHITVAAFRRPRQVMYTIVVFAARTGPTRVHAAALDRLLATLRARRPVL